MQEDEEIIKRQHTWVEVVIAKANSEGTRESDRMHKIRTTGNSSASYPPQRHPSGYTKRELKTEQKLRHRDLIWFTEVIQRDLRDQIIDLNDRVRTVESAPITMITYARVSDCKRTIGSGHQQETITVFYEKSAPTFVGTLFEL